MGKQVSMPTAWERSHCCTVVCSVFFRAGLLAVSLWAFNNTNSSASECASNCTNNCGNNVQNNSSLRAGLFGSVAPLEGKKLWLSIDQVLLTCRTKCINRHFSGVNKNICFNAFHIKGGTV